MQTSWQDPARGGPTFTRSQPSTSNEAAHKFSREAEKWESASRAASWGTRRSLGESDLRFNDRSSQARHLSLTKRAAKRSSPFLNETRGIFPPRTDSGIEKEPQRIQDREAIEPMTLDHLLGKSNAAAEQVKVMPTLSSGDEELGETSSA